MRKYMPREKKLNGIQENVEKMKVEKIREKKTYDLKMRHLKKFQDKH